MSDIELDGEILPTQDVPQWLTCGKVAHCLELRKHLHELSWTNYAGRPVPMTWPWPNRPALSHKPNGIRVQISEHEAKLICAYFVRDASELGKYIPQLLKQLDLPEIDWGLFLVRSGSHRDGWFRALQDRASNLAWICSHILHLLEEAIFDRRELPRGWDTTSEWPESPVRNAQELAAYFTKFAPWSDESREHQDDERRDDPAWYWRKRVTIHIALDAFKVPCPLERTNRPQELKQAIEGFTEILLWLRNYVSDAQTQEDPTKTPEHSPWIDAREFGSLLTLNGHKPSQKTGVHPPRTVSRQKKNWQAESKPMSNNQKFRFKLATLQRLRVDYPPAWNCCQP